MQNSVSQSCLWPLKKRIPENGEKTLSRKYYSLVLQNVHLQECRHSQRVTVSDAFRFISPLISPSLCLSACYPVLTLLMPAFRPQINHVGPVPSSYYVRDHVKVDYEQCTLVKRGSSQQMDYEILFPGCVLRSVTPHESSLQ